MTRHATLVSPVARLASYRVIVTGADGMLGRAFVQGLRQHVPSAEVAPLSRQDLDVRDAARVRGWREYRPDIIIHCAGMSSADACEREPNKAWESHVEGTRHVVHLASDVGAQFLYPQSVFIFDGTELPVTEQTQPRPSIEYGRVKLRAEQLVLEEHAAPLVVRMAGFFGGDDKDKNFVGTFVRALGALLASGSSSIEVGDRIWQPTYTHDLALNSLLLLARGCTGIYHMGSLGEAAFHEVAHECVQALGASEKLLVVPTAACKFGASEAARRPMRMVTRNDRLDAEGLNRQRPWREALREYLARPYFNAARLRVRTG